MIFGERLPSKSGPLSTVNSVVDVDGGNFVRRLLCTAGDGCIHRGHGELLWETLWKLAIFLVLHYGLGGRGTHFLLRCV